MGIYGANVKPGSEMQTASILRRQLHFFAPFFSVTIDGDLSIDASGLFWYYIKK